MAIKCKYYPKAPCLTGDHEKCEVKFNEWNDTCPYYKVHLKDSRQLYNDSLIQAAKTSIVANQLI